MYVMHTQQFCILLEPVFLYIHPNTVRIPTQSKKKNYYLIDSPRQIDQTKKQCILATYLHAQSQSKKFDRLRWTYKYIHIRQVYLILMTKHIWLHNL